MMINSKDNNLLSICQRYVIMCTRRDLTQLLLVRRLFERRYVDDWPGIDGQTTGLSTG